jgi:hypothetical protein
MLYENPAVRSRVEVYLFEEAKGGPSKLLLSFLLSIRAYIRLIFFVQTESNLLFIFLRLYLVKLLFISDVWHNPGLGQRKEDKVKHSS